MHLGKLYTSFDSRCNSYYLRLHNISRTKASLSIWEYNYLTETLISDVWQSWNNFSRELIFSSCRGTKARDNTDITKRVGENTWKRLGYEASHGLIGRATTPNGHLSFVIRKEPTWGDLDVFLKVTTLLAPANATHLLSTYGSFTNLKDLQKLRNACAHKNIETISQLNSLSGKYSFTKLERASDLAWQSMKTRAEHAMEIWLYEMNLIADYATSKS